MFNSKLITSSSTWLLPAGSGVSKHKKNFSVNQTLWDLDSGQSGPRLRNPELWPWKNYLNARLGQFVLLRNSKADLKDPLFFPQIRIFEVGSSQLTTAVVNAACEDSGVGERLQLMGCESRSVWSSLKFRSSDWLILKHLLSFFSKIFCRVDS